MRVMVTGGGGWIGGYVCQELERRNVDVIPAGIVDSKEYEIYRLDVTARHEVVRALTDTHPDAVINLAGYLGTEELHGREYGAVRVNVLGAINVFDAAVRVDARVVQIGTGHKGQPNPYAITKACAEDIALSRAVNLHEHISVVRAYHAYGPGQRISPPHGDAHVRKIIPSFVCRALTGMPIEIFGEGGNLIDLVYVGDVASVLVDAALAGVPGEVLEAGTGVPIAVSDVAHDIIAVCNSSSMVEYSPARPGEPIGACVVAHAPRCVNPWPYMLDETIEWYAHAIGASL